MNVKDLIEKLQQYPQDAQIETEIDVFVNHQRHEIYRRVEYIRHDQKNNKVHFLSEGGVKLFM